MILERCEEKDGIVIGCRGIIELITVSREPWRPAYFCVVKIETVISCGECNTCPRCGMAPMMIQKNLVDGEVLPTYHERKVCPYCSHNRKGELTPYNDEIEASAEDSVACSVYRCNRKAYEGHEVSVDGKSFKVCSVHRDQMRHWKTTNGAAEKIPLLAINGMIKENLEYIRKRKSLTPKAKKVNND